MNTPGTAIRVLIVDDHEVVRRGLAALMGEAEGLEVCGQARDAREALETAVATRPDVAVVDVRLGSESGVELTRDLADLVPDTRVIMLTSFNDEDAVLAAIVAGAAGYLLKQVCGHDLIDSVRRVAAGECLLHPSVTRAVLDRLRSIPDPLADPKLARLSPQETRVLQAVAEGLTNRGIAARLGIAEKTAKNHVSAVLSKLEMSTRAEAAAHLARHGSTGGRREAASF